MLPNTYRLINGVDVPVVILGDLAYPLLPWLIKPYPGDGSLTPIQRRFNYQLSRARMVVECAFGRLKGRWRCLMKRNDTDLSFMPTVVSACCVLHNLCEVHHDDFNDEWMPAEDEPTSVGNSTSTVTTTNAETIRKALSTFFN